MIELFNYFTIKFLLFFKDSKSIVNILQNRDYYEVFLYYSYYAMQDNGYMFISSALYDKFNEVFSVLRHKFNDDDIIELENSVIRRVNKINATDPILLDKMGEEAIKFECDIRNIPWYLKYDKRQIAAMIINDLGNMNAIISGDASFLTDKLEEKDFIFTLTILANSEKIAADIPRFKSDIENENSMKESAIGLLQILSSNEAYPFIKNFDDILQQSVAKKTLKKVLKG